MPPTPRIATDDSTLVGLLARRASTTPDAVAYRFLRDDLTVGDEVTCGELAARADAIAAHLRQRVEPGDRALMLYPPGLDFLCAFLGCLRAGVVAVPAYPPRVRELDARILAIAADASPRIGLATSALVPGISAAGLRGAVDLPWLATDEIDAADAAGGTRWVPTPDTLAHLQYTSGSTATPKGVSVTHRNLLRNLLDMHLGWQHDEASVMLSWLPHFHDMGLVYGLLGPLFAGVPGYAHVAHLLHPAADPLAAGDRHVRRDAQRRAEFRLRSLRPQDHARADRETLDLCRWRVAFNGAEPVRAETIQPFATAFAPCGFRPRRRSVPATAWPRPP